MEGVSKMTIFPENNTFFSEFTVALANRKNPACWEVKDPWRLMFNILEGIGKEGINPFNLPTYDFHEEIVFQEILYKELLRALTQIIMAVDIPKEILN